MYFSSFVIWVKVILEVKNQFQCFKEILCGQIFTRIFTHLWRIFKCKFLHDTKESSSFLSSFCFSNYTLRNLRLTRWITSWKSSWTKLSYQIKNTAQFSPKDKKIKRIIKIAYHSMCHVKISRDISFDSSRIIATLVARRDGFFEHVTRSVFSCGCAHVLLVGERGTGSGWRLNMRGHVSPRFIVVGTTTVQGFSLGSSGIKSRWLVHDRFSRDRTIERSIVGNIGVCSTRWYTSDQTERGEMSSRRWNSSKDTAQVQREKSAWLFKISLKFRCPPVRLPNLFIIASLISEFFFFFFPFGGDFDLLTLIESTTTRGNL